MSFLEDLKFSINILLITFCAGMMLHFGANTAKLIWPNPPVEFQVSVSE